MSATALKKLFAIHAALIGVALLIVRWISQQFAIGTTTIDHPYIFFVLTLMIAGLFWTSLIWLIPKLIKTAPSRQILIAGILLGIAFRALFLGSTPIYENDWNRYLWDGAVLSEGINPYTYSPHEVLYSEDPETEDLDYLQDLSHQNDNFAHAINYGELTTIYPPIAQVVFGLSALINPFDLDTLRVVFIIIDGLSIFLLIKTLTLYGRDPMWSLLYALNPLLIYAGFNAVHMDIILVPFLLLSFLWIKTKPYAAALALAGAAAVKLWPLILAPVLFKQWRSHKQIYLTSAAIVACAFVLLMLPLILALNANAGVVAYAGEWSRNAFFFPLIESFFGFIIADPGTATRLFVAAFVSGLAIWMGFKKHPSTVTLPHSLLFLTAALFLLSPTGYPWYAIWLLVFIPFVPSYGVAALTVFLPLYYTRYALSEQGLEHIYENFLIPVQFVVPVAILIASAFLKRRADA